MQSTFSLAEPRPTAGACILARLDRTCAMGTSNARIILIVQSIVGNAVAKSILPDHFTGPIGDGADLHQVEFRVPIDFAHLRALGGLAAANGRDPGVQSRYLVS